MKYINHLSKSSIFDKKKLQDQLKPTKNPSLAVGQSKLGEAQGLADQKNSVKAANGKKGGPDDDQEELYLKFLRFKNQKNAQKNKFINQNILWNRIPFHASQKHFQLI